MQVAYPANVKKESRRQKRRREKLAELLEIPGSAAELAQAIGTPASHLSAILAGRRSLGDELAEKIEAHCEKPGGWFDQEGFAFWPFSDELHAAVEKLDAPSLERLEGVMRAHLGFNASEARDFLHQESEADSHDTESGRKPKEGNH
jgi:transcriptional regulator with XRE-family HTH domain